MADLTIDIASPPPSTAPVIVQPIPASESRTISLGRLMTIWTIVVGALPDIIELLLYLVMSDPKFADTVAEWFPRSIRYPAMAAIIAYARKSIALRKVTVAPIAGTDSAKEMLPATDFRSRVAPVPTDGGETKSWE